MIHRESYIDRLPPRLSMDEYADFVEASLGQCNRVNATRQKEIEERISVPFRMSSEGSTHSKQPDPVPA